MKSRTKTDIYDIGTWISLDRKDMAVGDPLKIEELIGGPLGRRDRGPDAFHVRRKHIPARSVFSRKH